MNSSLLHRSIDFEEYETIETKPLDCRNARAYLIGVSRYNYPSWNLATPVQDIEALAQVLEKRFRFNTCLLPNPGKKQMEYLLSSLVNDNITEETPVLIYFAGHGAADKNDPGTGYLIPSDGQPANPATWYDMASLIKNIEALPCRHLLLILDCCFGGTIRWANNYDHHPGKTISSKDINLNHYQYYTRQRAWQVITSTAPDQKALDSFGSDTSPFSHLLVKGLEEHADSSGDKVITTTELISYLQRSLSVSDLGGHQQNVGLYWLNPHENGDFLFCPDGFDPGALSAVTVNPYRGLEPYSEEQSNWFFGRNMAIQKLTTHCENHHFIAVIGASGTGKSSLVRAGLLPRIGTAIPVIKPGRNPMLEAAPVAGAQVLVIDQFEQLITQSVKEHVIPFWELLMQRQENGLKTIVTVRIDYEKQLPLPEGLKTAWDAGRFLVPGFSAEELREIIVTPTARAGRLIEPITLVDKIVQELIHYPGSLPLLSFTMMQLFDRSVRKSNIYGKITESDYNEIGGVIGALEKSADNAYHSLPSDAHRHTMRNIMLRMLSLTGGERAGRRVLAQELVFNSLDENQRVQEVLHRLTDDRLIVKSTDADGRECLEPAHDALVRTWGLMSAWIADFGEEHLLLMDRLGKAVEDHAKNKHLWHDNPGLKQVQLMQKEVKTGAKLNRGEAGFVAESERVRRRKRKTLIMSVSGVIFSLVILLLWALYGQVIAQKEARMSNNAAIFIRNADSDPTLSYNMRRYNYDHHTNSLIKESYNEMTYELFGKICYKYESSFSKSKYGVSCHAINFDNKKVLITGKDGTVKIWDVEKNKAIVTLGKYYNRITAANFSPLGNLVLFGGTDNKAILWNIENVYKIDSFCNFKSEVKAVAFSPDGNVAAIASENKLVIYEIALQRSTLYEEKTNKINNVLFSPDGKSILLSISNYKNNENIIIKDIINRATIDSFPLFLWGNPVAFSPDGKELLILGFDVQLLNIDTKKYQLIGNSGDLVNAAAFSSDGKLIVIGNNEKLEVYNKKGQRVWQVTTPDVGINLVKFHKDNRSVFSVSDTNVREWSINTNASTDYYHHGTVTSVTFSGDGKKMITGSIDSTFLIWDIGKKKPMYKYKAHCPVNATAFSNNGSRVFVAGGANGILIYNTQTNLLTDFIQYLEQINILTMSPDGKTIAALSNSNLILFDLNTKREKSYPYSNWVYGGSYKSIAVSFDGTKVIGSSPSGNIVVNINANEVERIDKRISGSISLAFSNNNEKVVAGDRWGRIFLNDLNTKTEIYFDGHTKSINEILQDTIFINSVAFSSDNKCIMSSDTRGLIKIWDIETGRTVKNFLVGEKIFCADFTPDGKYIVAGTGTGKVLWLDVEKDCIEGKIHRHSVAEMVEKGMRAEPEGRIYRICTGIYEIIQKYSNK